MRKILLATLLLMGAAAFQSATAADEETTPPSQAGQWLDLTDDMSRSELAYYEVLTFGPPADRNVRHAFVFPVDAADGLYGVDVSHHNGVVDWTAVAKGGARFVYIKATQGERYRDAMFATNWAEAAKTGTLRRGAYHFLTADVPGKDQAKAFLALLDAAGGLGSDDLTPVLDIEWDLQKQGDAQIDRWSALTPAQIVQNVLDWTQAVQAATGRLPMIYTSASWWNARMNGSLALKAYPQWIADYRSRSISNGAPLPVRSHTYLAWQFTDGGRFKDASGKFDVNRLKGSDLKLLVGK